MTSPNAFASYEPLAVPLELPVITPLETPEAKYVWAQQTYQDLEVFRDQELVVSRAPAVVAKVEWPGWQGAIDHDYAHHAYHELSDDFNIDFSDEGTSLPESVSGSLSVLTAPNARIFTHGAAKISRLVLADAQYLFGNKVDHDDVAAMISVSPTTMPVDTRGWHTDFADEFENTELRYVLAFGPTTRFASATLPVSETSPVEKVLDGISAPEGYLLRFISKLGVHEAPGQSLDARVFYTATIPILDLLGKNGKLSIPGNRIIGAKI